MDGVRFDGEDDGADDGKGEADAEYEDDQVMDSVVEDDGIGDNMQPKHKLRSKPQGALKRQRNQAWNRKCGKSAVAANDDEFVPHPFGEGACREWHFRDDVTEQPYVKVAVEGEERREETLTLVAGEGIAIGRQPCEFHKNEFGG